MTKYAPEVVQLRLDIEHKLTRRIRTPYDFEFLVGAIWERLHENISPTTLKRLWGYIDGADSARRTTLCILSRFLGYDDWDEYLHALLERTDVESATFLAESVHATDLQVGQQVEVTWLPNRRCIFNYLGEGQFVVTLAENAKIHVGDTFICMYFIKGQPMYIDHLVQGCNAPVEYVAGNKGGLISVTVLNQH